MSLCDVWAALDVGVNLTLSLDLGLADGNGKVFGLCLL